MGNFYYNITLRGPDRDEVVKILSEKGEKAFISPSLNSFTTVYNADYRKLSALSAELSGDLGCSAVSVTNHDDDVLYLELHIRGTLTDRYNSSPGYFENGTASEPAGGDAPRFSEAMGAAGRAGTAEQIFREPAFGRNRFTYETDRHRALASALGLPEFSVGFGYSHLREGDMPDGSEGDDFIHVGKN